MVEHIDYGVRDSAGAVTWCRYGGKDQALENIAVRRIGGLSATLVTRTRTDWEEVSDG